MTPSQITPHGAALVKLTVAGVPIAALRAEPADPIGAVALLVPGYTGSKEDFAPLLDPLGVAGLTVLAVDLPGQHESMGPGREQDYLPDDH